MRDLPYHYPTIDDNLNWLHEEDWLLGYTASDGMWLVAGFKCGLSVQARGDSLEQAVERVSNQVRHHMIAMN